ncbi:best-8 [Pristionchus pacificus]|uniref:Bestrophin homolog n=1 Tax=Pristionchus pacificus TaxID=54126 RepID=A0A2A6C3D6_PRIPA|nr:best-8 [Pristionchus pacificus]|eukprot:PDM72618.1 best-8 [Pristionchus pacificus]
MTVSYNLDVSKKSWANAFKILFRWRGSIWRLVWKELIIWLVIYYAVMVFYRSEWILTPDGQRDFERLAHHIDKRIDWIPLTFILAFFVAIVLGRWTRIIDNMGYIENAAITIAMTVRGTMEKDVIAKRSLVRYLCLAQVLVFRDISVRVRRRFPNLESIVQAGFMEEEEKELIEELDIDADKYWMPCNWACSLAWRLKESNNLTSETPLMHIVTEIKNFRSNLSTLCNFDWVPVPVAYPQVVYFAVYIYFLLGLIGRQVIIGLEAENKDTIDIVFPFMTVLQFVFYVGWVKVAESLLNPMGEDDDHFECNSLIDKNITTALAIVDDTYDQVPTLRLDRFKTQKDPMYAEGSVRKVSYCPQFMGSAAALVLAAEDELVNMVAVKTEPLNEEECSDGTPANGPPTVMRRNRRLMPSEEQKDRLHWQLFLRRTVSLRNMEQSEFMTQSKDIHRTQLDLQVSMPSQRFNLSHSSFTDSNVQQSHHRGGDHVIRAPALDEILEEESPSRKSSVNHKISGEKQVCRQMLHVSGTHFEDERIPLEKWEEYRKTTPFGYLPLLTIDGKVFPQSFAMARYLAKKLGFDGKTAFESAWVDAIGDQYKERSSTSIIAMQNI